MHPFFLAFSLSFLYPMPLWKVGVQFVKKHCINDAKKSYFCYVLQCFVNFNILPQDTQKSANQNLETVTPPQNPPSKTYRGETQSDINRFPSSQSRTFTPPNPPPSKLKLICFVSVSSVLFLLLWALVSENSHLKLICFVSGSSVLCLSSCGPWCQKTLILN